MKIMNDFMELVKKISEMASSLKFTNIKPKMSPHRVVIGDYIVCQAENYHISIRSLNDRMVVFQCEHNKKLDDDGLKEILNFYLEDTLKRKH